MSPVIFFGFSIKKIARCNDAIICPFVNFSATTETFFLISAILSENFLLA